MKKFLFSIGFTVISIIIISCNSCSSKYGGDTSYLEGDGDYYDYEEYTKEVPISDNRNPRKALSER